jgi:hypothetical protein
MYAIMNDTKSGDNCNVTSWDAFRQPSPATIASRLASFIAVGAGSDVNSNGFFEEGPTNTKTIFRHTDTMSHHAYIQVVSRFHCKIINFLRVSLNGFIPK